VAQSMSMVLLHIIFSTKDRTESIPDVVAPKLHAYLAGTCRKQESEAFRVGGTSNHIHLACSLPRTLTISHLVEEIKKSSSAWMKRQDGVSAHFSWQAGYGAFSLGHSQVNDLVRYIDNQLEHHKKRDFKEEFIALLMRYGVEYDPRYLWT
jgi:REP-associated tyrosine transposase